MKLNVNDRLLRRELNGPLGRSSIKAIYGDKAWVRNLDIINELEGHDGCVNALSWSKSGNLLASGSDDQRLNIHRYQSEDSTKPFSLATTVQTGHSANIFSVKFMPHSNDQTLITAAGDHQIRVFDIEYSGRSAVPAATNVASAERIQGYLHNGTRFLSTADTNARIYRSHSDRVKRIVTESSPHLFLSCSEDGEVRQWDLRQPSSAYPRQRDADGDSSVPPPLISYKRYQIDLNTISCSPSQPHYIALGGAHLHTFLHDRRMLGRNQDAERGQESSTRPRTQQEDDLMGEATRCVRRFAPSGRQRMKRSDNGHITACKISDAHPNEMIASWSGDYIYSFDLIRSPDARDLSEQTQSHGQGEQGRGSSRAKHSRDRKRKRTKEGSVLSQEGAGRAESRPRQSPSRSTHAFRVQYVNGQSEEIPIRESEEPRASLTEDTEMAMSEEERRSYRIANTSVAIRKALFMLGIQKPPSESDPTGHASSFTSALGFSATILEDMDDVIRTWRYPVEPDEFQVITQTTLRRNRESARRLVQAAGTVSRLLGGNLFTGGRGSHPSLDYFVRITPAPNESNIINSSEQFRYDFIKAISLWLDSGPGAIALGFGRPKPSPRFPLPQDSGIEAIDEILIPYLLQLASDTPIPNVDSSRFEVDENRQIFKSERAAVMAFADAIRIPFADLHHRSEADSSHEIDTGGEDRVESQDRKTALKFWGMQVARGLLLLASQGVNHSFVDRAFGGLGIRADWRVREDERAMNERLGDIDPEEDDPQAESVILASHTDGDHPNDNENPESSDELLVSTDNVLTAVEEIAEVQAMLADQEDGNDPDHAAEEDENDDEDIDSEFDDEHSEDDSDDNEDGPESLLFRHAFTRSSRRHQVNQDVPCSSHIRHYSGHCNVKTVKDVNFYGLDDEYVVSGSDSGHLFIWDKQTQQLLNILEGDGEVVNVAQGHPYEPMLAVSGIDHTIKIFSSDAHARHNARHGIGVTNVDSSGFSSLRLGRTRFGARRPARNQAESTSASNVTTEPAMPAANVDESSDEEGFIAPPKSVGPSGLSSRRRMYEEYAIVSQNDHDRRGGQREAYITQSMLAQLASRVRLQMRRGGGAGGPQQDGDGDGAGGGAGVTLQFEGGGSVVLGDDCQVM